MPVHVAGNGVIGPSGGRQQHDPGAQGEPELCRAGSTETLQDALFRGE
jgi:hypothetical protein